MGLWKNKEDNETVETEEYDFDKLEEQTNALRQKALEYVSDLNKTSGITVKAEGKDFDKSQYYIFYVNDTDYVFIPKYEKRDCYFSTASINMDEKIALYHQAFDYYRKLLDTKPICLSKSQYSGKDVPIDYQSEKREKYAGEMEHPIGYIEKKKKNNSDSNEDIKIKINNLEQDFSILGDLKQLLHLKNFYNILDIPEDSFQVSIINGNGFCHEDTYHAFRERDCLLFVCLSFDSFKISIVRIKSEDILYYRAEGSVRYEQQISGGGGMGINYGSAILGGLLFGEAGAIIGSRRNEEISEIESKTITHDDRIVTLVLRKDGRVFQIGFDVNDELALDWLIPEKQYDYVIEKRRKMFEGESSI